MGKPKCPSTEEWIKKMEYYICVCVYVCVCVCVCVMEYYLAIKKNEKLPFAATWMDVLSSDISQIEKDKYMISLMCGI